MEDTGPRMRKTFRASFLDSNLPFRFEGEIHSVFSKAFNIRTREDELISIVASGRLNGPQRILLELSDAEDFLSLGIEKGMKAAGTAREISIEQGNFLISLREARRWSSGVRIAERIPDYGIGNNLWFLRERLSREKDGSRISQELGTRIQRLMKSIKARDLSKVSRDVENLIGFGDGLTPSGDDFLTGLLAALYFSSNSEAERLLKEIKGVIRLKKKKTTFLSGKFLEHACQGRFSETILDIIEAIFTKDREGVEKASRRCLDFGASSGRAILIGIVEGLGLIVQSQ